MRVCVCAFEDCCLYGLISYEAVGTSCPRRRHVVFLVPPGTLLPQAALEDGALLPWVGLRRSFLKLS